MLINQLRNLPLISDYFWVVKLMSGLFKGILKLATFGLYSGSSEPQPVEPTIVEQQPTQTAQTKPANADSPFDASHFWQSGESYVDLSYHQLNRIEQEIIADITDAIDDIYNKDYDFEEATHITLNKTLDCLELCFKDGAKKFNVVRDGDKFEIFDDELFWQVYGDGEDIEDVYIPPK